jgi:hypothetical protein
MALHFQAAFRPRVLLVLATALILQACGGKSYSGGGGTTGNAPPAPTALTATAGTGQVSLSWSASSGAATYNVKRGVTTGGPYTQIGTASTATYVDNNNSLSAGSVYYYVVTAVNTYGESGNSNEAHATPAGTAPSTPTGLTATAGNAQVALSWTASSGATSYNVKSSLTHGGPYTTINSPTATSYTNSGLTNGTSYYYVVSAVNAAGESANSSEASAVPMGSGTSVSVTIDVLNNRHAISSLIYGGAYPQDPAHVTDSGTTLVRWGGNGTSTYNWKIFTYNADNDYYFEDYATQGFNNGSDGDSVQFVRDVLSAGGAPLMTMPMLSWVAQGPETSTTQGGSDNYHWSYSVGTYGAQCSVDQYNTDAGDGLKPDCSTPITTSAVTTAYFPLLDQPGSSDPPNSLYRNQWAAALAAAFGSAPHLYNMDNEIDIWGGTHRDIHPNPATYDELANIYLTEATNLKTWDPAAIRLGPVSCCWYYYWRSATGASDTSSHGGVDFLPWWLNQVAWSDAAAGARSLDVFDIHAYPDADTSGLTPTQLKALGASIYRDWWDPTFTSAASYIVAGGFSNEPLDSKPFRIPRMRALVNQIYPGTQFSMTEWSAAFAGESDFSTALGDADAYGILGANRVYLASRWEAPNPSNSNYQALKLYANYDGSHHTFGTTSVSATNTGDPNLFSSYAALNASGTALTIMVLNKDPANAAQAQFALNGFTPTSVVTYTLASTAPTAITASTSKSWSASMTFAPYTATLLVIAGSMAQAPASEWDLNPDTIMVPAGGSVTLQPKIVSGTANVTLTGQTSDSGITVALTQTSITPTQNGTVTINAGSTPGFYHFTVTGADSATSQTQTGWIVVGKPAATLTKTGDNQTGGTLTVAVTLAPESSGGTATGASILFTTNKGTLSQRIATTNSSGVATVTLTLPSGSGTAQVTAEGPYGLGHPVATFTESN